MNWFLLILGLILLGISFLAFKSMDVGPAPIEQDRKWVGIAFLIGLGFGGLGLLSACSAF